MRALCILFFILTSFSVKAQLKFSASKTKGCEPMVVNFTDQTPSAAKWDWDFGNGNSSPLQNPSTAYFTGNYSVTLTTWDNSGKLIGKETKSNYIACLAGPTATISADLKEVCPGEIVKFTSASSATKFSWDFGDGSGAQGPSASHAYKYPGTYNISIQVIDANGCENSITSSNLVKVTTPPALEIKYEPYNCPPDAVSFGALSPAGAYDTYKWQFGDYTSGSGQSVSHQYQASGTYKVTLTATKAGKCGNYVERDVFVYPLSTAKLVVEPDITCVDQQVSFRLDGLQLPASSEWDFGDQSAKAYDMSYASHVYTKAGTYLVKVKLRYKNCNLELSRSIIVDGAKAPKIDGYIQQIDSCFPLNLKLTDNNYSAAHYWLLPDDNNQINAGTRVVSASIKRPFMYESKVKLVYTYGPNYACAVDKEFTIYERAPRIQANAELIQNGGCQKKDYKFTATADNCRGCKYSWTDNGVEISDKLNFNYSFTQSGNHNVIFTATNASGCSSSSMLYVQAEVKELKVKIISDVTYKNCPPANCRFSVDFMDYERWRIREVMWTFGDGDTSYEEAPVHMYVNSGAYTIRLRVKDDNNCYSEVMFKDFVVIDGPVGRLSFPVTKACPPAEVAFQLTNFHKVKKAYLDYGDGIVENAPGPGTYKHTYNWKAGTWYPSLIMVDSLGCTNKVRANTKNSVTLYPLPLTDFTAPSVCENKAFSCKSSFNTQPGNKTTGKWYVDGKFVSASNDLNMPVIGAGSRKIKLIARTENNCVDSLEKTIRIFAIKAGIKRYTDTLCVGERIRLSSASIADTIIASEEWFVDKVLVSKASAWDSVFVAPGIRSLKYKVTDAAGCTDEVFDDYGLVIGDTQPPAAVPIRYVSTASDRIHEIVFEKAGTFDFRNYYIWDGITNRLIDSVPDISQTVFRKTGVLANQQSYCYKVSVENLCYRTMPPQFLDKHCTVELKIKADTNRMLLNWNAYTGWDTVQQYRLERHNPKTPGNAVMVYTGKALSYTDSSTWCLNDYIYRISAVNGSLVSYSDSAGAKAVFKNYVPAVQPFLVSVEDNREVLLKFSPPQHLVAKPVSIWITESATAAGSKQVHELKLASDTILRLPYRYTENPTYIKAVLENECLERSSFGPLCNTIHLDLDASANSYPVLKWNKYNFWPMDAEKYIIERDLGSGFTAIATVYTGAVLEYEDRSIDPGSITRLRYRIQAVPNPCMIEEYPLVHTDISYSNTCEYKDAPIVYVPSAFSPNRDRINEFFNPSCHLCNAYTISIYNRWGEQVWEGEGWNGEYKNLPCPDGVYMYTLKVKGLDNRVYNYSGSFELFR